ncbi:HigA family addiction module antidote protein [Siccirubricoccus deserti]|uniref:histidine kinase n=1 Tax=Siccirubricoccus deserti TaxID=2013562 RepID=A0A9X0UER0_9PROT|nr:HigA family addiction module antidote protein [Siccirubricoccus deserti]
MREHVLAASGFSIARASRELGVTRQALHRLLSATASVTPEMAIRLGRFCGTGAFYWLNLQQEFDLAHAKHVLGAGLDHIPTHPGLADKLNRRTDTLQTSATLNEGQRMPAAQREYLRGEVGGQIAAHAAVLGQVAEGVIVADATGRITFVNDAAARIHGTVRLDVLPDAYSETFHLLTEDGRPYPPADLPLTRAVLCGETVTEARWRIRRPDGSEVLAQGSTRPLLTAEGKQVGAVLTLRDETARYAAEQALRASEERFRGVFDQQFQFMAVLSPEGVTLEINELPLRITGLTREQVIGRLFWDTPFWADIPAVRQAWPGRLAEAARTEGPVLSEDLYQAAGGEICTADAAVTAVRGADRAVRFFVIQAIDTTARKQTEAALRESEARLRLATEAVGLGIWDVDLEGEEGIGTPRIFEIYGLPAPPDGRALRTVFVSLMHPDSLAAIAAEHERTLREGGTFGLTHRIRRASDHAERWVEVHGRHFQQAGRRRFLAVLTDVTERKAAEERQALLAREVDHRAKNVLAVVQAMLRLTPRNDAAAYARAVEGRVRALAQAQTLLAEDRWSGVDMRALVQGELAIFIVGQRAELDGLPVKVPAGAAQPIAMALHELAMNAVKHGALSVPEGRVSVSWTLVPASGTLRLRWAEADGPAVAGPPGRRGFGMRVLEGTVRRQLGGTISLGWEAAGLVCEAELPLVGRPGAVVGADSYQPEL